MAVEDPCQLQQIMAVLEFTAMGLNMYPSTVVQFEFISIQTMIVHQELIFPSSGYPPHGKVEIALFTSSRAFAIFDFTSSFKFVHLEHRATK